MILNKMIFWGDKEQIFILQDGEGKRREIFPTRWDEESLLLFSLY